MQVRPTIQKVMREGLFLEVDAQLLVLRSDPPTVCGRYISFAKGVVLLVSHASLSSINPCRDFVCQMTPHVHADPTLPPLNTVIVISENKMLLYQSHEKTRNKMSSTSERISELRTRRARLAALLSLAPASTHPRSASRWERQPDFL